jgi:hypothetical protein
MIHGRIDVATGEYTPYTDGPSIPVSEAVERTVQIDPDTATHEAQHVAWGCCGPSG